MLSKIFAPSRWLMGQLKFAGKFVLLAAVLLAPLGYVTKNYFDKTNGDISFAQDERTGVDYLSPALDLKAVVDGALIAGPAGQSVEPGSINAAVGALDSVSGRLAAPLTNGTDASLPDAWSAAKTAISAALSATADVTAQFDAWSAASTAMTAVVQTAGDDSNLTLDPIVDTYYVGNAAVVNVRDTMGYAALVAGLTSKAASASSSDLRDLQMRLAVASGSLGSAASGLSGSVDTAAKNTSDKSLRSNIEGPSGAVTAAVKALTESATTFVSKAPSASDATDVASKAAEVTAAGRTFAKADLSELGSMLANRVDSMHASNARIEKVVVGFLLIALYCFGGLMVGVSMSVKAMLSSLRDLAEGRLVVPRFPSSRDELGQMGTALTETVVQTRTAVESISQAATNLTHRASEVSAVSEQIATSATETTSQAETVASATEEMGSAIREIAQGSAGATEVASQAAFAAGEADATMMSLDQRSQEITAVVEVISEIAEQTNLLALNATIEAARAGEAGKGFAVVADEVKSLANETARATDSIAQMVASIQRDTSGAVQAISNIRAVIGQVNETQQTISVAVEEQAATTNEIGHAVSGFAVSAGLTSQGAEALTTLAMQLNAMGTELSELVGRYSFE
jgi:methyl-accepting chemotaxis protein